MKRPLAAAITLSIVGLALACSGGAGTLSSTGLGSDPASGTGDRPPSSVDSPGAGSDSPGGSTSAGKCLTCSGKFKCDVGGDTLKVSFKESGGTCKAGDVVIDPCHPTLTNSKTGASATFKLVGGVLQLCVTVQGKTLCGTCTLDTSDAGEVTPTDPPPNPTPTVDAG